jgi:hypothetical protein
MKITNFLRIFSPKLFQPGGHYMSTQYTVPVVSLNHCALAQFKNNIVARFHGLSIFNPLLQHILPAFYDELALFFFFSKFFHQTQSETIFATLG